MKKIITICLMFTIFASLGFAHPRGPAPAPRHFGPPPPPPPRHHYHSYPSNWWIGPTIIGGAILGSSIVNSYYTAPSTNIIIQDRTYIPNTKVITRIEILPDGTKVYYYE